MSIRFVVIVVIFFLSVLPCFAQSPEFNVKAQIVEEQGRYEVSVEIKSNFPKETILDIEVYYAKKYFVPANLRNPGQPEYDIENIRLLKGAEVVSEPNCTLRMGNYIRKPYAGDYLVKVIFNPNNQPEGIRQKLPQNSKEIVKEITFTFGKPEDLENQKKQIKREIYQAMENIKKSHQLLVRKVSEQINSGKFNPEKWKWSVGWMKVLDDIKQDNESRLEERIYHIETAGKHSVDALCSDLKKLKEEFESKAKSSDNLKALETDFVSKDRSFTAMFDESLNMLNFGMIIDKSAVKSLMEEIEKNLGLINSLYAESNKTPDMKKQWKEKVPEYQNVIQRQLFKLTNETSDYIFATYTAPFTQDFLDYLDVCNKQMNNPGTGEGDKNTPVLFNHLKKILSDMRETLELE